MTDEPLVDLDITVNGERHNSGQVPADMPLVHYLHEVLGLTGTKIGCSIGECRACTVAVRLNGDTLPVTRQACMTSMRHTAGWNVTTVEGLADDDVLNPVQQAIVDEQSFQCGYCAAGFAVAGSVVIAGIGPGAPDDAVAKRTDAILGPHICRCTGYGRYRNAILSSARAAAARNTAASATPFAPGLVTTDAAVAVDRQPPNAPATRSLRRLTRAETTYLEYTPIFDDPTLELIRLLRDGAEIEHSLLVQYLYAAFSIKLPDYIRLAGWPNHRYGGRPLHLMGVAIEEMTHLDIVNELLVALGAAPHLSRQQFPYEKDIYPFDFVLEPLSLHSIAKYVYVEAPPSAIDLDAEHTQKDWAFIARLYAELNANSPRKARPNQVGSLYRKVGRVLQLLQQHRPDLIDYSYWESRLDVVRQEGETEHFELFRSLFDGTHPALPGDPDIWDPARDDCPVIPLRHDSGLPRSGEPIVDEPVPAMRYLADLHYWSVCMLLDLSYRMNGRFRSAARRHMAGPLRSLGTALAHFGEGLPFDAFVAGYAPGVDTDRNVDLTVSMIEQVKYAQEHYARHLPADYAPACVFETAWELSQLRTT